MISRGTINVNLIVPYFTLSCYQVEAQCTSHDKSPLHIKSSLCSSSSSSTQEVDHTVSITRFFLPLLCIVTCSHCSQSLLLCLISNGKSKSQNNNSICFLGDIKAEEFKSANKCNKWIKRGELITEDPWHKKSTSMWVLQRHTKVKGHKNTLLQLFPFCKVE